jgi:putative membrane protein
MAIKHYTDHAANERTFLAWVRTSIAVTAFGFLVQRFDLFLSFTARQMGAKYVPHNIGFGRAAGLGLIAAGVVMVLVALFRFVKTAKEIDDEEIHLGTGSRADVALALLLAMLGIALFVYLLNAVASNA